VSSHLLLENVKIQIYKADSLPVVLHGFEIFFSHLNGRTEIEGL
jgi:hypothetical protein